MQEVDVMRKIPYVLLTTCILFTMASCRLTQVQRQLTESSVSTQKVNGNDLIPVAYRSLVETFDSEKREPQTVANLEKAIDFERDLYLSLEGVQFTDTSLNGLPEYCLSILDEGSLALQSYGQADFSAKWDDYQEKRSSFYRILHQKNLLFVPVNYQLQLDFLLADDNQKKAIKQFQEELQQLLSGIKVERFGEKGHHDYQSYKAKLVNNLDYPIQELYLMVHLKNAQGNVEDTLHLKIEDWQVGEEKEVEGLTAREFVETEVLVDYLVVQWPWQYTE